MKDKEEQEEVESNPHGIYLIHAFDKVCEDNHIDHRLTKPPQPWTNGQVERMNGSIKEATVKRYH